MRKLLGTAFVLFFISSIGAQEQLEPIGGVARGKKRSIEKSVSTLDSTFIYTYDTLALPLLDEFSTSKVQSHIANPGDPNVTETLYHKMLDMANVPVPASQVYTSTVTKRYSLQNGNTTAINLTPIPLKVASLNSYPFLYSNVNAFPPYDIYDTLDFPNDPDTVWLDFPDYVQDSARIFEAHVTGQNAYWIDSTAYRNYTHAVEPWTLGVMTFDGLDENGYPYAFNSTASGYNDYLTTKAIDLSGYVPLDSLYLTFIVQKQGFGDAPEAGDSLVLEFYNDIEDDWDRVWAINGGPVGDFKLGHIRITHANYLTEGFRMRFKNYGGVSGMLDEFHLDYVYLRAGSGYQDTLLKDFAFVYPMGSLIETYTQVPWDHWVNDPTHMNDEVQVTVRNGSNLPENSSDGAVTVSYNGAVEGNFVLQDATLLDGDLNYGPRTVYQSFHDFTGGYTFTTTPVAEEKIFDLKATATAPFAHIAINDTSYTQQIFRNEYAYDDGSAEAAYGINGTQARLAVRFDPYEADTLMGVKIHFVPSIYDLSNKLFLLTVWADNGGVPGTVIYEDNFLNPRTPVYEDGRGVFTDYYLSDSSLALNGGPFYVGYRQVDADKLNTGFDRNIDNSTKTFFSLNGGVTWINSSIAGTVMMRPIFSTTGNQDLSVEEAEVSEWMAYPNPTTGIVNLRFDNPQSYEGAIVRSINGQIVGQMNRSEFNFDMSNVPAGIYFIEAINNPKVIKVVRQ